MLQAKAASGRSKYNHRLTVYYVTDKTESDANLFLVRIIPFGATFFSVSKVKFERYITTVNFILNL